VLIKVFPERPRRYRYGTWWAEHNLGRQKQTSDDSSVGSSSAEQ